MDMDKLEKMIFMLDRRIDPKRNENSMQQN